MGIITLFTTWYPSGRLCKMEETLLSPFAPLREAISSADGMNATINNTISTVTVIIKNSIVNPPPQSDVGSRISYF